MNVMHTLPGSPLGVGKRFSFQAMGPGIKLVYQHILISSGREEVYHQSSKDLANLVEYPRKRRSLYWNNLVVAT